MHVCMCVHVNVCVSYPLPDEVMAEKAADLTKGHWSRTPRVLPPRKVVDTQIINVGLVQLPGGGRREG